MSSLDTSSLEVLAKVDAFYKGAFDSLLQLTIAMIGLSVVLVPLIISFIQSRALRKENAALKSELSQFVSEEVVKKVESFESSMRNFLDGQLVEHRSAISNAETDLKRKHDVARGGIFYIQGAAYNDKEFYAAAAGSFLDATGCMLDGGDYVNLRKAINQLLEILPKLNKSSFDVSFELENNFESVVKKLSEFSESDHYADCIRGLKIGLAAAKVRDQIADAESIKPA